MLIYSSWYFYIKYYNKLCDLLVTNVLSMRYWGKHSGTTVNKNNGKQDETFPFAIIFIFLLLEFLF